MATRRSPDTPVTRSSPPAKPAAARAPRESLASASAAPRAVTPEARRAMIAERAYLRAERRGFPPGQETEDWLVAEREIDLLLKARREGSSQ